MTNCPNETMRDLLPLLAHDALEGSEAELVRAHVASCAACSAELQLLERAAALFSAATPAIDTGAILAKLPTAPSVRPTLRVEQGSLAARRPSRVPRYALAAAASLLLMATISVTVLRPIFTGTNAGVDTASVDTGAVGTAPVASATTSTAAEPVAIVGGTELSDLGVDELTQLLNELDQMDANVAAEPRSLREPITSGSEGM